MRTANPKRTDRARNLRHNATDAEKRLWLRLCNRQLGGWKFNRQIAIGPFFGDLVCRDKKLIVELDGGQHATSTDDRSRTLYLEARGYRVIRFWNHEVFENIDGVLARIKPALDLP